MLDNWHYMVAVPLLEKKLHNVGFEAINKLPHGSYLERGTESWVHPTSVEEHFKLPNSKTFATLVIAKKIKHEPLPHIELIFRATRGEGAETKYYETRTTYRDTPTGLMPTRILKYNANRENRSTKKFNGMVKYIPCVDSSRRQFRYQKGEITTPGS